MAGCLIENNLQIWAVDHGGQFFSGHGRDFLILHALQQPHRAIKADRVIENEVPVSLGDQVQRVDHVFGRIGVGQGDLAVPFHGFLLIVAEAVPDQVTGEIGCGGDADHADNPFSPLPSGQHHQPAAK